MSASHFNLCFAYLMGYFFDTIEHVLPMSSIWLKTTESALFSSNNFPYILLELLFDILPKCFLFDWFSIKFFVTIIQVQLTPLLLKNILKEQQPSIPKEI